MTELKTKNIKRNTNQLQLLTNGNMATGRTVSELWQWQDNKKEENHIGQTDHTFETRYNGHTSSLRNENKISTTTLSKYIWSRKDKSIQYSVKWRSVAKCSSYSPSNNVCNLCLREKYFGIYKPRMASLKSI